MRFADLSSASLTAAIGPLLTEAFARKARAIGAQMAIENAATRAATIVENSRSVRAFDAGEPFDKKGA